MIYDTQHAIKRVTESLRDLLLEKNTRYGDSALQPLHIFTAGTTTAADGIAQRLDDKLGRIKNSEVLRKNDVADLMGYLVLLCVAYDWVDFEDLID